MGGSLSSSFDSRRHAGQQSVNYCMVVCRRWYESPHAIFHSEMKASCIFCSRNAFGLTCVPTRYCTSAVDNKVLECCHLYTSTCACGTTYTSTQNFLRPLKQFWTLVPLMTKISSAGTNVTVWLFVVIVVALVL